MATLCIYQTIALLWKKRSSLLSSRKAINERCLSESHLTARKWSRENESCIRQTIQRCSSSSWTSQWVGSVKDIRCLPIFDWLARVQEIHASWYWRDQVEHSLEFVGKIDNWLRWVGLWYLKAVSKKCSTPVGRCQRQKLRVGRLLVYGALPRYRLPVLEWHVFLQIQVQVRM